MTEIKSGRGRILAPFDVKAPGISTIYPLLPETRTEQASADLRMSTAAVLSARFPWLTPAGSFRRSATSIGALRAPEALSEKNIHLVDGGYFDNSGVITALAVVREVERAVMEMSPRPNVQINLVALTSGGFDEPPAVLGDYFAPVQAILATRSARGAVALEAASEFFSKRTASSLSVVTLEGYGYPLPLGWRLSPITRLLILGQNGDVDRCRSNVQQTADCLKAKIYRELTE